MKNTLRAIRGSSKTVLIAFMNSTIFLAPGPRRLRCSEDNGRQTLSRNLLSFKITALFRRKTIAYARENRPNIQGVGGRKFLMKRAPWIGKIHAANSQVHET